MQPIVYVFSYSRLLLADALTVAGLLWSSSKALMNSPASSTKLIQMHFSTYILQKYFRILQKDLRRLSFYATDFSLFKSLRQQTTP